LTAPQESQCEIFDNLRSNNEIAHQGAILRVIVMGKSFMPALLQEDVSKKSGV
jgi:hypothetical protein